MNEYLPQPLVRFCENFSRDLRVIYDKFPRLTLINNVIGVYFCWVVAHFTASFLYSYHCTHCSWYGFIVSPLMTATPYCRGILWVVTKGSDVITNMWVIVGTAVSGCIINYLPTLSDHKKAESKED